MIDPLAYKIAHRHVMRYLTADAISDIPREVQAFEDAIKSFAEYETIARDLKKAEDVARTSHDPEEKEAATNWLRRQSYEYLRLASFPKISLMRLQTRKIDALWLGILQQYALAPAVRKKVEACAKLYGKTRAQVTKKGEEIETFEKLMALYRDHLELAKSILATSKPRGEAGTDVGHDSMQAGPFKIVNTGGFDEKVMTECARVCEHAASLLHAKGLGKVCYGEILISNTLSRKNVLAFYLLSKDEMFVRANLKGHENDALKTVIHELAHRLEFKFLTSKKREIHNIYAQLSHKQHRADRESLDALMNDPDKKPKPGDKLTAKGKTFVVERLEYSRTLKVIMHDEAKPDSKASVGLDAYFQIKGLKPTTPSENSGFVTNYASTDPRENFAEMIAYYCLNKLPDDQVEMLKTVL